MAYLTLLELFDIIIMTLAIGFVFHDVFRSAARMKRHKDMDIIDQYTTRRGFDWRDFWYACAVVGPAILLHELSHKTVAMAFGFDAVFHAAYIWLLVAVVLKLIGFPFIFFVPAFVEFAGRGTGVQHALVALAGPALNLILWLGSWAIITYAKRLKTSTHQFLFLVKQVNMFLFIFNMLPIPGFDGWQVYAGLFGF
jgi:Zn-dependent protease